MNHGLSFNLNLTLSAWLTDQKIPRFCMSIPSPKPHHVRDIAMCRLLGIWTWVFLHSLQVLLVIEPFPKSQTLKFLYSLSLTISEAWHITNWMLIAEYLWFFSFSLQNQFSSNYPKQFHKLPLVLTMLSIIPCYQS